MIVLLVVLSMCWGEGGVEDIMDWVGVISTYI